MPFNCKIFLHKCFFLHYCISFYRLDHMACKWWDKAAVQPCTFCIPQWPSLVTVFYINIVNCIIYVLVDLDTCSLVSGNQEGKRTSLTQWELIVFKVVFNSLAIAQCSPDSPAEWNGYRGQGVEGREHCKNKFLGPPLETMTQWMGPEKSF